MNDTEKIAFADEILAQAASAMNDRLAAAEEVLKRIVTERHHAFVIQLAEMYFRNPKAAAKQAQDGFHPAQVGPPDPIPETVGDNDIFPFGKKYRGIRMIDLVRTQPNYCAWLLDEATGFHENDRYKPLKEYIERALGREQVYSVMDDPMMKEIPF